MLRLIIRLFGLLFLAGGFVATIVDGTRAIAGGRFMVASLHKALSELFPAFYQSLQADVESVAGFLWDPLLATFLLLPVSLLLVGLGAALIILSHKRVEPLFYTRQ